MESAPRDICPPHPLPDKEPNFPIVGIGASAGGLEALTQLFRELPADTGMGFVIVQHLSPAHSSNLSGILSRRTAMKVCEVGEDCGEAAVEPNHVYVLPPGRDIFIADRKLQLLPQERHAMHRGIDHFFRSLAQDCGHQAIGVILSGFANDGTRGIEHIRAAGGITLAQDESALQRSMPESAIASGCVDFVLSAGEIGQEIARIARHPYVRPKQAAGSHKDSGDDDELAHLKIIQILNSVMGADFTLYKMNTLHRRITRRMLLHKLETLSDYETYLQRVAGEAEALFADILINVTSFFRDPEPFEYLKAKIFPQFLQNRSRKDPLRIWTLGCSTGEEAYSLAIAYTEYAESINSDVPLQVLATDLNNTSIGTARQGLYPKSIAEVVSQERLQRFFVEEANGYRICKKIRQRCIFSKHNVLNDPPFSQVDLVSCRNLLIYMQPVLQQRVMPLLHYALKPGGCLWLGSSETAGTSRTLFELENAPYKLYTKKKCASTFSMNFRPRADSGSAMPHPQTNAGLREIPRADLQKEAERILLSRYAPPGVVITAEMDILQFRGDTGAYLAPAAGAASFHLLKMLREGLLVGVRSAITRASETGRAARENGLKVKDPAGFREVAVDVIPVRSGAGVEGGFLILFDEGAANPGKEPEQAVSHVPEDEISRVTLELAATREYLQTVIDQQESINAELQSANEEAQSANEEMQSVIEELETSKEEIQSSNEELATVNDELSTRNIELGDLNASLKLSRDYAENLVASVRSPLLILNAALQVKTANAAFYETFRVTPVKTEGRLVYDLGNGQWNIPVLRHLLEHLLPNKDYVDDFEVRHDFEQIGPRTMLLNARHLHSDDGQDALIVLAIEDITARREQEESLQGRAAELSETNRSKDEFLAMLAHELRNPLASLSNAVEIIYSMEPGSDPYGEAQGILARQVKNLTRMVDDLLDVSRITEGKIGLRKNIVPLNEILHSAAGFIRPQIESRHQKLAVTLPTGPVFLNADTTRLDQIFSNLLTNASKYSNEGSLIHLSAELTTADALENAEIIVRIRDEGIGIAPEMLPRIFGLFVQATKSLDRTHGGLGIGLTLVQRLVKMHNGTVEAHSDGLGKGSEFIVRLPVFPGSIAMIQQPVQAREASRRILIVDDNEDSANSMCALQRYRGHEVRIAVTGPSALAVAAAFLPEIVLLDIGLPGMDGYEVARHLRATPTLANIFLVAMTGYGSHEDRALAREVGFDEYLVKPVDLNLLRRWLQDWPRRP